MKTHDMNTNLNLLDCQRWANTNHFKIIKVRWVQRSKDNNAPHWVVLYSEGS